MKYEPKSKKLEVLKQPNLLISTLPKSLKFEYINDQYTGIGISGESPNHLLLFFYSKTSKTLKGHNQPISSVHYNRKNKKLFSADVLNRIIEWDIGLHQTRKMIIWPGEDQIHSTIVCMEMFNQILLTANDKGVFDFYDLVKKKRDKSQNLGFVPIDVYYMTHYQSFMIVGESNTEILEVEQRGFHVPTKEITVGDNHLFNSNDNCGLWVLYYRV